MVRRLGGCVYDRRVRAVILAIVAITAILRGWAYLGPGVVVSNVDVSSVHLSFLDNLIPIQAWAAVWLVTGAIAIAGIRVHRLARLSMSLAVGMWLVWSLSYLIAWGVLGEERAWVNAVPLAGFAALLAVMSYLMEPPRQQKETKR